MSQRNLHRPLLLAFVALSLAGCQSQPALQHGTVYQSVAQAPPLSLETTDGSSFSLEQVGGKTTLVYFGYTQCPDFCPATLATLDWMLDQLGDRSDQVQVVFVSVDPERDTPEVLQRYLDAFRPGMIGLTGDLATLKETVAYAKDRLSRLSPEHKRFEFPHVYKVGICHQLLSLRSRIMEEIQQTIGRGGGK